MPNVYLAHDDDATTHTHTPTPDQSCHPGVVRSNHDHIRESIKTLQQDLHEAELSMHKRPLKVDTKGDVGIANQYRMASSVNATLSEVEHAWQPPKKDGELTKNNPGPNVTAKR